MSINWKKMSINQKIEKFISDNSQSKIIRDLHKANEERDRKAFARLLNEIKKCIGLESHIRRLEKEKESYSQQLKQLKCGHNLLDEFSLFDEEGLKIHETGN